MKPLLLATLLLASATTAPHTGTLQDGPAFSGPGTTSPALAVSDYSPHGLDGDNVSEIWNYVFDFSQGHTVSLQFMITNIGPGDSTAVMIAYFRAPDGEVAVLKNSRKEGEWEDRSSGEGPWVDVARHTLRIRHPVHRIVIDHPDGGKFTVTAVGLTEMYQPGRADFGRGRWYDVNVIAPRLRATGSIQLPGRRPVVLEGGRGIGIHTITNMSDDRLATAWLRIDTFDAPRQLSLFELTTSKRYGQRRLGFALEFENDRLVGHSLRYGHRLLGREPDPDKPAYPTADAIRFGAVEGVSFRGQADLALYSRNPMLDFLNSAVLRFVLRMLTDPILYQYRAPYEVVFGFDQDHPETVRGTGVVSLYVFDSLPAVY